MPKPHQVQQVHAYKGRPKPSLRTQKACERQFSEGQLCELCEAFYDECEQSAARRFLRGQKHTKLASFQKAQPACMEADCHPHVRVPVLRSPHQEVVSCRVSGGHVVYLYLHSCTCILRALTEEGTNPLIYKYPTTHQLLVLVLVLVLVQVLVQNGSHASCRYPMKLNTEQAARSSYLRFCFCRVVQQHQATCSSSGEPGY